VTSISLDSGGLQPVARIPLSALLIFFAYIAAALFNGPGNPQNCPFSWGISTSSNTWFLGPTRVYVTIRYYASRSRRCLSMSIQLSSPAPHCCSSAVGRSKEDNSPCICIFAPRLLQLSVVRRYRQPGSTSLSCTKCCRTSCQWHSPMRTHHASIETTSPASSTATY